MFYKNIDILLQSNSLHTVEEEYDGSGKNARVGQCNSVLRWSLSTYGMI